MISEMVTVRVDFYPTGDILPLGVTNSRGNSLFIDKIVKVEKLATKDVVKYFCLSNGSPLVLVYNRGVWYIEKNEL